MWKRGTDGSVVAAKRNFKAYWQLPEAGERRLIFSHRVPGESRALPAPCFQTSSLWKGFPGGSNGQELQRVGHDWSDWECTHVRYISHFAGSFPSVDTWTAFTSWLTTLKLYIFFSGLIPSILSRWNQVLLKLSSPAEFIINVSMQNGISFLIHHLFPTRLKIIKEKWDWNADDTLGSFQIQNHCPPVSYL